MRPGSPIEEPGGDWRALIHALSADRARILAGRARSAPLLAHAYAFHLNLRFGGMTPADLLDFTQAHRLDGLKIHVEDGEDTSLRAMTDAARHEFGAAAATRSLALHVETSSTDRPTLEEAVTIARSIGAESVRCYPRYEGRVSEIIARTTEDLGLLDDLDPDGRLRFTLEQHEDLTSDELVGIVERVGNPRLTLLFDFGNMINAYERPLAALARQAAHVTEVHVKDCRVVPDRGGWGHRACVSGQGHLPMHALLAELLLLGDTRSQVTAYGLEEEDGYFAPALRYPAEGPDPFIAARSQSYTDPGAVDLGMRLWQEAAAARTQVETVRAMLQDIAAEAEHRSTSI